MFRSTSKSQLLVTILFNISVIWLGCTIAAPTLLDESVVTASQYLTADGKFEGNEADQSATTVSNTDLLNESTPNCDLSSSSTSNSIEVALFYVNQTNFVFIAIDVFDATYFSSLISYTSKEFTNTKLHDNYQISEDYAGLVKAAKVNDQITLNLNGISPNDKASTFKLSRYLCTKGEIPIADYILLESVMYPGHYIRRHDDQSVDCEPEQKTTPSDVAHFYWKVSAPQPPGSDHVQLVSPSNNYSLTFSNNTAYMAY